MRFLIVCSAFPPASIYGGTPLTAFGLAKGLLDLGQEVLVLTTNANGAANLNVPLSQITLFNGVPVIYQPRWGSNAYFWSPALARCLKELGPGFDLALVRGNWGYINLAASRILHGKVPFFLYPEGIFDPWAFRYHYYKKVFYWHLIEKCNYRRAAAIIALTKTEAEQVKQTKIQGPVEVIPNGVFLEEFDRKVVHNNYPYTEKLNRPVILYLGRIHLKKGIDILIEAINIIPQKSRPLLVIAGDGDKGHEKNLRHKVARLNLAEDVLFTGFVTGEEKLFLLKNCSMLALPSKSEGLPHAVLEGMACRKPVIITPWCNLPEVQAWEAGLLVSEDAQSIAQAIQRLLNDGPLREKMGQNGYALVKRQFTWKAVAEKTHNFAEIFIQ
jgi:glycosyltransferase involved in cell wall biosynthesis